MTHTKGIIAQLRENERDENLPEEVRESSGERADELAEELEKDPAENLRLILDMDTTQGRRWFAQWGEETPDGPAVTETRTQSLAACESCGEKKWCYHLPDLRGIPECRSCLESRPWVEEIRTPEEN